MNVRRLADGSDGHGRDATIGRAAERQDRGLRDVNAGTAAFVHCESAVDAGRAMPGSSAPAEPAPQFQFQFRAGRNSGTANGQLSPIARIEIVACRRFAAGTRRLLHQWAAAHPLRVMLPPRRAVSVFRRVAGWSARACFWDRRLPARENVVSTRRCVMSTPYTPIGGTQAVEFACDDDEHGHGSSRSPASCSSTLLASP
jgi:hypothetical protein